VIGLAFTVDEVVEGDLSENAIYGLLYDAPKRADTAIDGVGADFEIAAVRLAKF
jgi:hypothetical protein